jgi:hypothetical protein
VIGDWESEDISSRNVRNVLPGVNEPGERSMQVLLFQSGRTSFSSSAWDEKQIHYSVKSVSAKF